MSAASEWLSAAIVALTLILILLRPRGLHEAWAAAIGASLVLATGGLSLSRVPSIVSDTADVLIFLAAMMILTVIIEGSGVFDDLAERCANAAAGSGRRLFVYLFVLGALTTAFLSLDVTVIVLTPIIYTLTRRRQLNPIPFLFGCTFVANTASLIFPMSNLTNLIVYNQLSIDFGDFVAAMWFPNVVAALTNLLLFLWIFRRQIPAHYPSGQDTAPIKRDWWFQTNLLVMVSTLAGLIICGLLHEPLSIAALAGALVLLAVGIGFGRISLPDVSGRVSWPVLVFVVAMLIVVSGFEQQVLDDITLNLPHSQTGAIIASVSISAIGSNIVNNVPMTLLAIPAIERAPIETQSILAYGTLVGSNIGPALTTYGSLATMLWLTLVRRRGIIITTRDYLRIGLVSSPVILVTTSIALWFSTR